VCGDQSYELPPTPPTMLLEDSILPLTGGGFNA